MVGVAIFSNADKIRGRKLTYMPVVEGERSRKNLHVHFAIGKLPNQVRFDQC